MLFKKRSVLAAAMAFTMLLSACTTTDSSKPVEPAKTDAPVAEAAKTDATPAPAANAEKKVLHINNHEEPGSLHPALAQGTHESWVLSHMFEGLYTKNPEGGAPELAVAKEAKTSDDGLTWTFTLRDDAKWSNGEPVVAKDFVSSWLFCLEPANAAKYASQLYILKGAEEYNSSKETDAAKIQALRDAVGVQATDDHTLVLTLVNPLPYLPDLLTHYTFYPVNTKLQESDHEWATKPAGYISNGPFMLTEWKNKEKIVIDKNPNYRLQDKVKIDRIEWLMIADMATEWQMYQQGELDYSYPLLPAVIEQLQKENNPELQITSELSTYYYLFNTKKKPFNNLKVREALSQSVNREALVKNVTKGGQKPAYGITPPGISDGTGDYQASVGDLFKEDLTGSKALLEEGLKEEGMTLKDFSFTILYNTNDVHKKAAEAIQAMWKQNLGIDVKLENAEFQVVLDRRHNGDYDVCRAGWVGDYADPMTFLEIFTSWNPLNDSQWSNAEYDQLIKTAQSSMDNTVRMEAMKKAEKMLFSDMVIAPLYFYSHPMATKPYLKGAFTPVNRYTLFYYADIVK